MAKHLQIVTDLSKGAMPVFLALHPYFIIRCSRWLSQKANAGLPSGKLGSRTWKLSGKQQTFKKILCSCLDELFFAVYSKDTI